MQEWSQYNQSQHNQSQHNRRKWLVLMAENWTEQSNSSVDTSYQYDNHLVLTDDRIAVWQSRYSPIQKA